MSVVDGRMVCALVIGHKHSSPGAVNENSGVSEFEFNDALARDIEARQSNVIIQRVYRRTYDTLPADINQLNPNFTISLHCNAYNKRTRGCEVLYHHRSEVGKQIAELLSDLLSSVLSNRNRGAKPRAVEDRGGYLLRYVKAPCVITEPFFIDNDEELANARSRRRRLATAYLNAIDQIGELLRPAAVAAPVLRALAATPPADETADTVADAAPEAGEDWANAVAHKTSIGYWAAACSEGYPGVLQNPQVKDMSFFNAEITPDLRRNEMRSVVGLFLRFHSALDNPQQANGISENVAFNLLVEQFTQGECRLSFSGHTVDSVYEYSDEQEA